MNKTVQLKEMKMKELNTMMDMLQSMVKYQTGEDAKRTKQTIKAVQKEISSRSLSK